MTRTYHGHDDIPRPTDIQTRAVATNLTLNYVQFAEHQRELAAEARWGGRALTQKLSARQSILRAIANEEMDLATGWKYNIDPAYSSWASIAQTLAAGTDPMDRLSVSEAEAMLSWPIYREALKPQVYVNVSGQIAETTVTRGEAEVIEMDWDGLRDEGAYEAEDWAAFRQKLSAISVPALRNQLLADLARMAPSA